VIVAQTMACGVQTTTRKGAFGEACQNIFTTVCCFEMGVENGENFGESEFEIGR
jgi:hypothetical protein